MQIRRCINCRHYEPSPLRGKGWCRNPLLHKRTENFLVDGKSLRCRTYFRDYWEPLPDAKVETRSTVKKGPVVRRGSKPLEASIDLELGARPRDNGGYGRGTARASRRGGGRRVSLRGLVVLAALLVAVAGWTVLGFTMSRSEGSQATAPAATPTVAVLAPGGGPMYPTPIPGSAELRAGGTAVVYGTGGQGLKVRAAPDIDAPVVRTLHEGTLVTLKEGPESRGGYRWWRIDDGQGLGWVVQDWLAPAPK